MAQVDISINGKTYRMACDEGQEERIRDLSTMVDAHVKDLVQQVGQVGDTRLLVMASLLGADELMIFEMRHIRSTKRTKTSIRARLRKWPFPLKDLPSDWKVLPDVCKPPDTLSLGKISSFSDESGRPGTRHWGPVRYVRQ